MKSYNRLLTESNKNKIVFVFGRMNPPTIGHEKVLDSIKAIAKRNKADYAIFLSQSHDSTKNPLTPEVKQKYFDKMFHSKLMDSVKVSPVKTPLEAAVQLYKKGYKSVVFVGGSDRKSMGDLLKKYNDKQAPHGYYKFDSIEFMSAGERDPDAEGASGMSASKVREFVKSNDFKSFEKAVPGLNPKDKKDFFNILRKSMKLDIIRESLRVKPKSLIVEEKVLDNINRDYLGYFTENFEQYPKINDLFREIDNINLVEKKCKRFFIESVKNVDYILSCFKNNTFDESKQEINECLSKVDDLLYDVEKYYNCDRGFLFDRNSLNELTLHVENYKGIQKEEIKVKSYKDFISTLEESCWPGYKQVGMKKKDKKMVPNCVKEEKHEVKQDPDVKDKKGTQPAKYFKGLSKDTKEKRESHFKKGKSKHWDDSSAYEPAPGDKTAKTKESKYTKAVKKKYPDLYKEELIDEGKADSSIAKKAEKSGISAGILKQVYNRGVAAWRTGHRPGTTPEQWGHARVNSFISGGKTRTTADADLWKKHKGNK